MSTESPLKDEDVGGSPNDVWDVSQLNLDDIQTPTSVFNKACDVLLAVPPGTRPTAFDLTSACLLLTYSKAEQSKVVHAVCHAAMGWGRVDLWARAIKSCYQTSGLSMIQASWILDGIIRFGFGVIRPTLQEMKQDPQLMRPLFALVDTLNARIGTTGPCNPGNVYGDEAVQWIIKSHEELIRSIGRSAQDECDKLIYKSLTRGGLVYLKENAIPVCVEVCPTSFFKELAFRVHRDGVFPTSALKHEVVLACFHALLTKLNHPEEADVSDYQRLVKATSPEIIELFKTVVKAGVLDIANELVSWLCAKLRDYMSNIGDKRESAIFRMAHVLSELYKEPTCDEARNGLSQPLDASPLFELACNILLDDMCSTEEKSLGVCDHRESQQTITKLCETDGGLQALLRSISQNLSRLRTPTLLALVVQLKTWSSKMDSVPELHDTYAALVQHYTTDAPLSTMAQIRTAVGTCCGIQSSAAIQIIADRLVSPGKHRVPSAATDFVQSRTGPQASNSTNFKAVLKWVLGILRTEAQHTGFLNEIGPALNTLILAWIQADIGVTPLASAPDLYRLQTQVTSLWSNKCVCAYCVLVQSFFLEMPCEMVLQLVKIPTDGVEHIMGAVEEFTPVEGNSVVDVEYCEETKSFWIVKRPSIFQPTLYPPFHADLVTLLQQVAPSEAERDQILGPTHEKILRWLRSSESGNKRAAPSSSADAIKKKKKRTT